MVAAAAAATSQMASGDRRKPKDDDDSDYSASSSSTTDSSGDSDRKSRARSGADRGRAPRGGGGGPGGRPAPPPPPALGSRARGKRARRAAATRKAPSVRKKKAGPPLTQWDAIEEGPPPWVVKSVISFAIRVSSHGTRHCFVQSLTCECVSTGTRRGHANEDDDDSSGAVGRTLRVQSEGRVSNRQARPLDKKARRGGETPSQGDRSGTLQCHSARHGTPAHLLAGFGCVSAIDRLL